MGLREIDFDPFADEQTVGSRLREVDFDPFADKAASTSSAPLSITVRPRDFQYPDDAGPGDFNRGLVTSVLKQTPELTGKGLEALSKLSPDFLSGALQSGAGALKDIADLSPEAYTPRRGSVFDAKNAGEFTDAAQQLAGQSIGSIVAPLATGLAGAGMGAAVGGPPGAAVGAAVGAGSASAVLNLGEVYEALQDAGVQDDEAAKWAISVTPAIVALDVGSLASITGIGVQAVKKAAIESFAKHVAKGVSSGGLKEAGTESAQEVLKQSTASLATGSNQFDVKAVGESALGGMFAGAPLGGVSAAARKPPEAAVTTPAPDAPTAPPATPPAMQRPAAPLTAEDIASPLPDDLIATGKAMIEATDASGDPITADVAAPPAAPTIVASPQPVAQPEATVAPPQQPIIADQLAQAPAPPQRAVAPETPVSRPPAVSASDMAELASMIRQGVDPTEAVRSVVDAAAPRQTARQTPADSLETPAAALLQTDIAPLTMPVAPSQTEIPVRTETPQQASAAVPEGAFDPEPYIDKARAYISKRGGSLNPETFGKSLGLPAKQASQVLSALASRPDSGLAIGRNGALRRVARTGPLDIVQFIASKGGIRELSGELAARDYDKIFVPRFGKLVRKTGMHLDDARALAQEYGYLAPDFPDTLSTSTVQDFMDAMGETTSGRRRVYSYDGSVESEFDDGAAAENERARKEIIETAREMGLIVPVSDVEAILYSMDGMSAEDAIINYYERRADDVAEDGADQTGDSEYENIPFGEDRLDAESGARPESEARDAGRSGEGGESAQQDRRVSGQETGPRAQAVDRTEADVDRARETLQLTPQDALNKKIAKKSGKKPPKTIDRMENFFRPGRDVKGYGGQVDRVISFHKEQGGDWSVTVRAVERDGDLGRVRNHATMPEKRELEAWEKNNPVPDGGLASQSVIPGAERTEESAQAKRQAEAKAEMDARQKQSKLRRGGQESVRDQDGGLFSAERDQDDMKFSRARDGVTRRRKMGGDLGGRALDTGTVSHVEIFDALREALDKIGLKDVKLILPITIQSGGDSFSARGAYQYTENLIHVAMTARDKLWTLHHEAIHALRNLGLFNNSEWSILRNRALSDKALMADVRARYDLDENGIIEEAIADMFASWQRGDTRAKGLIERIFTRVKNFIEAIWNALRGLGFKSAEDVFRAIESGEIGARERGASTDAETKFSVPRDDQPSKTANTGSAPLRAAPPFRNPESEKRYQDARKGAATQETILTRTKVWLEHTRNLFTRHHTDLPNIPKYADLSRRLRTLEEAPTFAKDKALRYLERLTQGLSKAEYDIMTRKVILDDLKQEAKAGHKLPFALNGEAEIDYELSVIEPLITPKIAERLKYRKQFSDSVRDDMVKYGVLAKEQIKNMAYFRHQVLDYARAQKRYAATGGELRSPYWMRREGSTLDINAHLIEAELDWMAKAITDIETAKFIEWLKASNLNAHTEVVVAAKRSNNEKIQALLDADKKQRGTPLNKEWSAFKRSIAMGLDHVKDAIESGALQVSPQFKAAALQLTGATNNDEAVFPMLAWILDNNKSGAMGAAQALKAISQRRNWLKQKLGKDYADPRNVGDLVDRFGPENSKVWQPDPGKMMFTAKTVPEHLIDRFVQELAAPEKTSFSREDMTDVVNSVREMLAVGGNKYEMVLPEEVVATINAIGDARTNDIIVHTVEAVTRAWKSWQLFNPRRVLKYNINNLSGDFDAAFAGEPAILKRTPQAAKELWAIMKNGAEPSKHYSDATARGVFSSGFTVQEIPDINELAPFRHLLDDSKIKAAGRVPVTFWRASRKYSTFRENIFRYAAYLHYIDQINSGKSMRDIGYGASKPEIVDAVTGNEDKAALLSSELLGDYGAISKAGETLRRLWLPFWSFQEINMRRYWRLGSNAYSQGLGEGLKTSGKIGVIVGARTSAWMFMRMATVYAALYAWNNLMFGDEEDDLDAETRARLHVILGRSDDGEVITLRLQGSLSDYLSWFGFGDAVHAMLEVESGRGSVGDVVDAVWHAPVQKVANLLSPVIKTPLEIATGVKLFPDAFRPRPIRDNWRHVLQTVSLDHEYTVLAGKPSRGYGGSLIESVINSRDVGESKYNEARSMAAEWNREVMGGEGYSTISTPRSEALYDWKMAIRFGDEEAEQDALARMDEMGMTDDDREDSIKRAHPLSPIAKKRREQFFDSLTPDELDVVEQAEEWYYETYR